MKSIYLKFFSVAILFGLSFQVRAIDLDDYPKVQSIVDELVAEKLYSQAELAALFAHAEVRQSVLDAMTNPAEYRLTWGKYRKIFLKEDRIQQGVEFWNEHLDDLTRAEREYGVPASVIVAIIGVETKFGRITGKHRVLDSLVTLVVGFPRRSAFFAKELKEFLILTKENDMDATAILGSYAGAVGYPQFISSSYRHYAIDFSGDGKADLIDNPSDAIGSVANYFVKNGWKPGESVTSKAHVEVAESIVDLANRKRKTKFTAAELRDKGANLPSSIDDDEKLNVLMLNASEIVPEPEKDKYYIVRAGDTACQIAEAKNVPCRELFKLNKLNTRGDIFRGQRLKLPAKLSTSKIASSSSDNSNQNTNKSGKWTVSPSSSNTPSGVTEDKDYSMPRYFYTHRNFYAITQYNHSVLYAMAVHDLSVAIEQAKLKTESINANAN